MHEQLFLISDNWPNDIKCWPYQENLSEAKEIMELANQKHEEIKRRLMVVEEELERAIDKSDDCERWDILQISRL